MTTDYVTERKPLELPAGNFIALADLKAPLSLPALISGLDLPETTVTGRVVCTVREGKIAVQNDGKETIAPRPLEAARRGTLHLEAGKFGHVLLFKPRGPAGGQ